MSQCLVFEIRENSKLLCNAYYHWSAYTGASLELVSTIYKNLDKIKIKSRLLYVIRLLETSGAKITSRSLDRCTEVGLKQSNFSSVATDRNEGLIDIIPTYMNDNLGWAEGLVSFDIATKMVDFQVFNVYTYREQMDMLEDFEIKRSEVKEFPYNITYFPIEQVDEILKEYNDFIENNSGVFTVNGALLFPIY